MKEDQFPELASLSDKALKGIKSFVSIIENAKNNFSSTSLDLACQSLLTTINYKKAIEEEVKSEKMREFKWENAESFVGQMKKIPRRN